MDLGKSSMKFKKSIKYRFRLLIVASILLTTLTYKLLVVFYSYCHERYLTNYYRSLLVEIENDYTHIKEATEWTEATAATEAAEVTEATDNVTPEQAAAAATGTE